MCAVISKQVTLTKVGVIFFCLLFAYIVKYTFFSNNQIKMPKNVFCKMNITKLKIVLFYC